MGKKRKKNDRRDNSSPIPGVGSVTWLKSPSGAQHRKFVASLPALREEMRNAINARIAEAIEIIKECDPLPLIFALFARTSLRPFGMTDDLATEAHAEYAQSLAMAVREHGTQWPDKEQLERFKDCVEEIVESTSFFFVLKEPQANEPLATAETKMLGMMRHLMVRGSSMFEHETELISSLFEPHDHVLKEEFKFTTAEFLQFCDEVETGVLDVVNEQMTVMMASMPAHALLRELANAHPELSMEELMARVRASDVGIEMQKVRDVMAQRESPHYEYRVSPELPAAICTQLALAAGENEPFLTFKKSPGWPPNDSKIFTRPLIKREGEFFCPNTVLLARNRREILEESLKSSRPQYYANQFTTVRGHKLEELALKYIQDLLPTADVYPSLYYRDIVDDEVRRFETDGLILLDDHLFVFEGKSAPLSMAALRGADKGLTKDLRHLVEEPYEQARRTVRFLESNRTAVFESENGTEIVRVRFSEYRRVYLLNVTLADIRHVATRLNSARQMKLLNSKEWPWAVFLNDLRVISELVDSPSEFLLYLERRLALNDLPSVASLDELEFFGLFLEQGLYVDKDDLRKNERLMITGYSTPINEYYDGLAGRRPASEKPCLTISPWRRSIIDALEKSLSPGRYTAASSVLSMDCQDVEIIESWYREFLASDRLEPSQRTLTGHHHPVIMFCALKSPDREQVQKYENYAQMKQLQTQASEVILIVLTGLQLEEVTCKVFDGLELDRADVRSALERYRSGALYRYEAENNREPGRNEQCPCNSGRKYKQCCFSYVAR